MTSTDVAERSISGSIVEDVVARGDLSKLTPEQRVVYYNKVCDSLGLNPYTVPFAWLTLQGKLILYAKRDACDQLRKINGIDIKVVDRVVNDGLLTVHVRATDKAGRSDEDFGVVSIIGLKGEAAANAMMKAVTKAKRRVTLSIAGLGFSDESEVESVIDEAQPFRNLNPSMSQHERSAAIEGRGGGGVSGEREASAETTQTTAARNREPPPLDEVARDIAEKAGTEPCEITRGDDSVGTWSTWATILLGYIRTAPSAEAINEWISLNSEHLAKLKVFDSGKYQRLVDLIQHQIGLRTEQGS